MSDRDQFGGMRALLVAATTFVVATACAPTPVSKPAATAAGAVKAPEPATLRFQLDWVPDIQHIGPTYADKKGFYKEQNLDVKVLAGGQGVDGLQMVAAGGAEIGISNGQTIFAANEKGLGVVGFAAVYQRAANALLCRGDRGISKFTDINGHIVGSRGPNDVALFPGLFKKNGVDIDKVKITPIGPSSITELLAGIIDCRLAFSSDEPITMRKAGITPVVFMLADYGYGGQGEIYITRQDFLEKNPEVLVRFLQATSKGFSLYLDNPEAAAQWIVDNKILDGLDVEQEKEQARLMSALVADDFTKEHGLLYLNESVWQLQAQQTLDLGRISKAPEMDKSRTYKILDAAGLIKR